ncbi:hypothetical protein BC938DRAFT_478552, partial [Jimgerdemannia flammicorona]
MVPPGYSPRIEATRLAVVFFEQSLLSQDMLVVKVPFLRRSFSDEYPADLSGSISPAAYNIRINSLKNIAFCQLPSTLLVYGLAAAICIISAMCAVWRYFYTSQEPGFFIALPITWLITLTIVFLWQKKQWHKVFEPRDFYFILFYMRG